MIDGQTGLYVLALIPAVLWGIGPIFSKRGLVDGGSAVEAALVVSGVGAASYWIGLLVLSGRDPLASFSLLAFAIFAGSGALGALVWILSFVGVDRVGASVNSAGFNTHPLFASVLGLVWLGETLLAGEIAGIVVIIVGLVALSLSKGGDIGGWTVVDLAFPLAAAGAYGIANVVRRFGLTTTPVTSLEAITVNTTVTFLVLLGYVLFRLDGTFEASRSAYTNFAISGGFSAVALLLMFEAFSRGPVAIVSALSGTAPVFTVAFTYLFLSDVERTTRGLVVGAALVVVGTGLITLS